MFLNRKGQNLLLPYFFTGMFKDSSTTHQSYGLFYTWMSYVLHDQPT